VLTFHNILIVYGNELPVFHPTPCQLFVTAYSIYL
jgi:hypothetical protein